MRFLPSTPLRSLFDFLGSYRRSFRSSPPRAQVRVLSNGIVAGSKLEGSADYTFVEAWVPVVSSAAPASVTAGDDLTLEVTNVQQSGLTEADVKVTPL